MRPDNFAVEIEKTTSGRWWAFVMVNERALFAGFADSPEAAITDALTAADRNAWRNQFKAPEPIHESR